MRELSSPIMLAREFPQLAAIWSRYQDDSFGNMIDAVQYELTASCYSSYICNFLGHDYISSSFYFCQYGDH